MGGKVFAQAGLNGEPAIETLRMNSATYQELKNKTIDTLSAHFAKVACPPEAPEKRDHGDLDILLADPIAICPMGMDPFLHVPHLLEAKRSLHPCSDLFNLAVKISPDASPPVYAQIDVRLCGENFAWLAFLQSCGDLGNILGVTGRGYGLSFTDSGLHLRIDGTEKMDSKDRRFFLGNDPDKVMDFVGLDKAAYANGFETEMQLFEWISQSRLMDKYAFAKCQETADEKRRMTTRPMFKRFVEEWAPDFPESEAAETLDRHQVRKQALAFFDKRDEYAARIYEIELQQDEELVFKYIKTLLMTKAMDKAKANMVIRGLKRWVSFAGGRPRISASPEMEASNQDYFAGMLSSDKSALSTQAEVWLLAHYEEVRAKERARERAAYHARR
ncbi:hypothetical protein M8818_005219 [Zalaria obscura]|uniref:Uncharacterized protein n=1 Tax=Zalaria obscura TaxID=2024903 RepID=A0ACC3S9G7_9PEZI